MTTQAMKGLPARKIAIEVLLKVEQEGAFANNALSAAFKNNSLSERDRAFVTYIVQGTLRHQIELDHEISKLSKKPLEKLSAPLRAILRSAIFQLIHMKDMPPSAVLNTSVEIARKTGHEGSAKFANGVLRSFERNRKSAALSNEDSNTESEINSLVEKLESGANESSEKLAKKFSLPEWILNRWLERYGTQECQKLLEHTQKIPILTLRTCEESISTQGLFDIFAGKGMIVEKSPLVHCCINVLDRGTLGGPVNKLPGYAEGLFAVQDEASALVALVVAPEVGQTVIDLCAAPGGKSVHLGELMQNKGRVVAVDISEKRLSLLGSERRRLGLQNIETVVADGHEYKPEQPCDAVLVDAPCTGTGVMNRRSDMRQNREESQIEKLVFNQRALLENAAKMPKVGGTLVYSTCSIEPEENVENFNWFVSNHPEYKPESLAPFLDKELLERWSTEPHWEETSRQIESGYLQLLPSRHNCSGFFICRLKRES